MIALKAAKTCPESYQDTLSDHLLIFSDGSLWKDSLLSWTKRWKWHSGTVLLIKRVTDTVTSSRWWHGGVQSQSTAVRLQGLIWEMYSGLRLVLAVSVIRLQMKCVKWDEGGKKLWGVVVFEG